MPENDVEPIIPKYPTGLKERGKRLWRDLHASGDFSGSPETVAVIEEACYLKDEIARLHRVTRNVGDETRVSGYNGQPVTMPESDDLRKNQALFLSMLKSIRVDPSGSGEKLTPQEIGRKGAEARWSNS